MNNQNNMNQKSNIIIYTTQDGLTKIETTFDEDTYGYPLTRWLNYSKETNRQSQGI